MIRKLYLRLSAKVERGTRFGRERKNPERGGERKREGDGSGVVSAWGYNVIVLVG